MWRENGAIHARMADIPPGGTLGALPATKTGRIAETPYLNDRVTTD
jgi:hypothetical protein